MKYDVIQTHNNKLLLLPTSTTHEVSSSKNNDINLDLFTVERLLHVDLDFTVSENYTYNTLRRSSSCDGSLCSQNASTDQDHEFKSTPGVPDEPLETNKATEAEVEVDEEAHGRTIQSHITGKSKRQRVGPSCDLCQAKKIKCDAYIEVVQRDINDVKYLKLNGAHVESEQIVSKHLSEEDTESGYRLLYSNNKLIKFRNCSFCESKGIEAGFKRGYTKEDIVHYNLLNEIKPKPAPKRRRRR